MRQWENEEWFLAVFVWNELRITDVSCKCYWWIYQNCNPVRGMWTLNHRETLEGPKISGESLSNIHYSNMLSIWKKGLVSTPISLRGLAVMLWEIAPIFFFLRVLVSHLDFFSFFLSTSFWGFFTLFIQKRKKISSLRHTSWFPTTTFPNLPPMFSALPGIFLF